MDFILDWICRLSPAIGASALVVIALITLVAWRGGTIDKIKIPGLFDVTLQQPIVFSGRRYMPVIAAIALVLAGVFAWLQSADSCIRCTGMPGETAWIYVGHADRNGNFDQGPFAVSETGVKAQDIRVGMWVKIVDARKTMIIDYDTLGIKRALESPFSQGKVVYTCKVLPVGQRLYVADRRMRGPNEDDQHLWFRVRTSAIGG